MLCLQYPSKLQIWSTCCLIMNEQVLAFEFIKRMVLAWDSDFTVLTAEERERFVASGKEIENGDTVTHSEIDWN